MRNSLAIIMALLLLPVSVSAEVVSEPLTYLKTADTPPMIFCSTTFESSSLGYNPSCGSTGIVTIGDVPDSCWTSKVNFNGKELNLQNNQKMLIPESPFSVSMKANGRVKEGKFETPASWSVLYTFEIADSNFLQSEIVNVENVQTLGKDFSIAVKTSNDFILCDGGYYIRASPRLYPSEERYYYPQLVLSGDSESSIPYKPTTLGTLDFKVYPYIQVGEKKLIQNVPASKTFFVAPVVNNPEVKNCNTNSDCPSGYSCEKFQKSNTVTSYCSKIEKPSQSNRTAIVVGFLAIAASLILLAKIVKKSK